MSSEIKIFFSEDSELVEQEVRMKEWRGDVVVQFKNGFYMFEFITLNRLKKEIQHIIKRNKFYLIQKTIIVLDQIKKSSIIDTLLKLKEADFDNINTVDLISKFANTFPELQDINNWIQVY